MQKVNLNLIPGSVRPVINVSQYDEGRQFQLAIYDGATSYSLTGKTVSINGTKADGHGFSYNSSDSVHGTAVVATSGNVATITTPQQMTAAAGECLTELEIVDTSNNIVHTLNFILQVEEAALGDNTIISDTEIPAIIDAANANANRAEAAVEHYPYINSTNKHWMVWDAEHSQWSDTGVKAEGVDGTSDYSLLSNKPQINSTTLSGNKSLADLGIPTAYGDLSGKPSINSVTLSGNKTASDLSLASDSAMAGASAGTAGAKGLVPAPAAGDEGKYLRGDGTWQTVSGGGGSTTLSGLTDTNISSPTDKQPLTYDNASSKWINGGVIPIANGGTGNSDGYIRTGQASGSTIGSYSSANGLNNTVSGDYSSAEGLGNTVSGDKAFAIGQQNTVAGHKAVAIGQSNSVQDDYSVAIGQTNTIYGTRGLAHGINNIIQSGTEDSLVSGIQNYAYNNGVAVFGTYNKSGANNQIIGGTCNKGRSDTLFELGNGTSLSNTSNALEVKTDGRIYKGDSNAFPAASNMSYVEKTKAANHTRAYSPGEYVYIMEDDQLYKVIGSASVSQYSDFTVGTNIQAAKIGEVLTSLNSDITPQSVVLKAGTDVTNLMYTAIKIGKLVIINLVYDGTITGNSAAIATVKNAADRPNDTVRGSGMAYFTNSSSYNVGYFQIDTNGKITQQFTSTNTTSRGTCSFAYMTA